MKCAPGGGGTAAATDADGGTAFSYASDELDAMAGATNYYEWILDRFRPYLGRRIMEVGAGIGTFSEYLAGAQPGAELTLLEPAENNVPRLRERFEQRPGVTVRQGVLDGNVEAGCADSVVAVNVLEHVPDDTGFVASAMQALGPGGHLVLFVPAGPGIFGTLDEAFEHYRRYTRKELGSLLTGAGFQLQELRYTNLPGVLAWWLTGRVLRRRTVSPGAARTYDRLVIPWLRRLETVWTPPAGQSLFAVGRKP
jgi:2-polyprenyl-3-methyl-5-hydroxy-6-metoxy-1,4-benzoquinol methylase